MPNLQWRKSSFGSGDGQGGNCVEVAIAQPVVAVRDSKAPAGSLLVTEAAWRGLVSALQTAHES
ncbi:DUF397 domain-containing protein [Amycolatopsis sp. FDAARGOS 1241]|nr:DUF397 domain-containing protein [Amycolatopsis sp. FDAARGOS 1241]QRP51295.1 DUF397 domain-containing protein [Amycolatopsis sp. FDAARGOS 1241]